MALSDVQLLVALEQLGLEQNDFDIFRADSRASAEELMAFKRRVHRNFRVAARSLHPDATEGDIKKAELFRVVSEFVEEVDKLRSIRPKSIKVHLRVRM